MIDDVDGDRDRDDHDEVNPGRWLTEHGFDRDEVDQFFDSMPTTTALRPAIQKLTTDQQDMLGEFVDGFRSRSAFIRWCQDAAVRTLGELPGEWYVDRAFGHTDMSVLLTGPDRDRWAPDRPLSLEAAEDVRRGVVAMDLLPACIRAHKRLRWDAVEYVQDEQDTFQPDPGVQKHTAMRPELTELDDRQGWAVDQLLDGFGSADVLLAWMQTLTEATYAEVDVDVLQRAFLEERATRQMLIVEPTDDPNGPFFRESFAARYLLPAFVTAAREVAPRAGELAEQESKEITETLL